MSTHELSHWNGKKPLGPQFTETQYGQRWRTRNPASYLCTIARNRAKKKGLPFNITKADVVIPTHCPILGIPLVLGMNGTHGGNPNSFSLDRIDPNLGYVKGNIQVISHQANSMKFTATKEELLMFARWIIKEYGN